MEMMEIEDGRFIMTLGKGTRYFVRYFCENWKTYKPYLKRPPLNQKY